MYTHTYTHTYIYIYMCRGRERERVRDSLAEDSPQKRRPTQSRSCCISGIQGIASRGDLEVSNRGGAMTLQGGFVYWYVYIGTATTKQNHTCIHVYM